MSQKVIVIGGVAGGASAAAKLRRLDPGASILILEKGNYISYANCGLPYFVGDVVKKPEQLIARTPQEMQKDSNIEVRLKSEVLSIDREKKTVLVKNHAAGETYEETYDKLILATGSSPLRPPIPGIDLPNVFSIWTIPDAVSIKTI
jgi:NADPH-dependent 2,4-dienoyl-CoA reductase/sulfur reductase-like enzyme